MIKKGACAGNDLNKVFGISAFCLIVVACSYDFVIRKKV